MNIKYSKIIEFILLVIILLNLKINEFFNIEFVNPIWPTLFLIIILLILTKNGVKKWNEKELNIFKFVNIYVLLILIIIIIEFIYSMIIYKQSFMEVFICVNFYFYILLAYPVIYIFKCNDKKEFLKKVMWITFFVLGLYFLQAFLYNSKGIILYKNLVNVTWIRNGRLRLNLTSLGSFMSLYAFYLAINEVNIKKYLYYLLSIFSIVYSVYVAQSRIVTISIVCTFILLYMSKKRIFIKQFAVTMIAFIAVILLFNSQIVTNLIQSFDISSVEFGGSTYARLMAVEHYQNNYYRNPVLGMGFICDNTTDKYMILHGNIGSNEAYYSDLGLLGLYFNVGIFAFVIFGVLYGRIIHAMVIGKKYSCTGKNLIVGIFGSTTINSISLLLFGSEGIFLVPFLIGAVEIFIDENQQIYE